MVIYVVKKGDTVSSIAAAYGVEADTIIYDNQLPSPYALTVGQALLLSAAESFLPGRENGIQNGEIVVPERIEKRAAFIGGYAYPFISRWVLEQTLPFLSDLYIFSYGFTEEGILIPPLLDDSWMIALAKEYLTAPVMTLTPFGADGKFDNHLISAVVNDLEARETLKNQIVEQIIQRGFEGLDIDFEFIFAADRQAFVDFVAYMQAAVSALGYPVSVALAPKSSADQVGLLYEGKDYRALGAVADYVLLMTYEWGYTYGPPMAVAPINKVREVVEYALTEIPAEKINLGIPNYGYDWPLPFASGMTKAETIGNIQAVQRAIGYGVPIDFDEIAQSPYFLYAAENRGHEVWFEDVRSMNATFGLMEEYGLRGGSYWTIMQLFRANWRLLQEWFEIF
ncbi:MAG: glycosyl hydrolase family 18 protein [Lachnospiraceae bacterium]|nr:glycosyl hydrolase family 18 protein [Lachnospiraceae bacterium]MDD7026629.1 glycosyl hydrolase family 18 protein [Lachnospiraceae bacterium]MDY5700949.1 glycosyl hydrolase family 18 protein [Lachnospiraceae bacterium]